MEYHIHVVLSTWAYILVKVSCVQEVPEFESSRKNKGQC